MIKSPDGLLGAAAVLIILAVPALIVRYEKRLLAKIEAEAAS